jgi:gamma-glutamyl-gamma-aminobutyrate hydrolase PuuD
LIEGIARAGHPFALGVQWHPELGARGGRDERIFAALVRAAGARALAALGSPRRD